MSGQITSPKDRRCEAGRGKVKVVVRVCDVPLSVDVRDIMVPEKGFEACGRVGNIDDRWK